MALRLRCRASSTRRTETTFTGVSRDDHLVEYIGRIKHAARYVASDARFECLGKTERDGRHDHDAGNTGRHDEPGSYSVLCCWA